MGTSSINDRGRGGFAICHVGFEEKALVPAFALQDDSRLFNPLGCMAENSGTGELEMLLVWFHSCGSYHPILISLKSWCDTRPIYSENNMEISPAVENPNMEPKISSVCFFLIRNGWDLWWSSKCLSHLGFMLSHTSRLLVLLMCFVFFRLCATTLGTYLA